MVFANVRDDGEKRIDHIGRIEPSSQTHLQDSQIDHLLLEIEESHCGGKIEEGEGRSNASRFDPFSHPLRQVCHLFLVDLLSVHLHPFGESDEMGRGVKTYPVTFFL